jgi:DNA repair protein RadC
VRGRPRSGFELAVVRVALAPAPGLGRLAGRRVVSHADAARVLARFLEPSLASRRLAVALLDGRDRLLAVALLDGETDSACRLRPSNVCAPAIVANASHVWLAHQHRSQHLWITCQDVTSNEHTQALGQALGVHVVDHLIVGPDSYATWREAAATPARVPLWQLRNGERRPLQRLHPLAAR